MSKNVAVVLVLVFLAASCLIIVTLVSVASKDATLDFLTAVAGVDISKYKIEKLSVLELGFGIAEQTVTYSLESDGSKMTVISDFRNGDLIWCGISRLEGSPILTVPSVDVLDSAKSLLNRYQSASKVPYLQPIQDSLGTLTELKSMTKEIGNVKLEVYDNNGLSRFWWTDTVNGIEIPQKVMGIVFYDGIFEMFCDYWNCYTVGNADVKFDREAAIQVAEEHAQNHSYNIGDTTVSDFTILDEYVIAELTMQDRGNYVVYPWWEIRLPLDKAYLGAITEIRVLMWADTGEVTYVEAIRGGYVETSSGDPANPTLPR
jgi:hypothetical protein